MYRQFYHKEHEGNSQRTQEIFTDDQHYNLCITCIQVYNLEPFLVFFVNYLCAPCV